MTDMVSTILYSARTYHVHERFDTVTIDVSFEPFFVYTRVPVRIEGVNFDNIEPGKRDDVRHALVILVGGKDILVKVQNPPSYVDGKMLARIFLDRQPKDPPSEAMQKPASHLDSRLEIGEFLAWLADFSYDTKRVQRVLNGPRSRREKG